MLNYGTSFQPLVALGLCFTRVSSISARPGTRIDLVVLVLLVQKVLNGGNLLRATRVSKRNLLVSVLHFVVIWVGRNLVKKLKVVKLLLRVTKSRRLKSRIFFDGLDLALLLMLRALHVVGLVVRLK